MYASAPISSANSWLIGAPPTIILIRLLNGCERSAATVSRSDGIVVVRRAESATMLASLCLFTSSIKVWIGTSTPRSITSKPALSNIIPTRFLPMSWRSPLTVPITMVPSVGRSVSAINGLTMAIPAFMARAAINTSGTNISPFLNFSPTTFMPLNNPSLIIATGSALSATMALTASTTPPSLPATTSSPRFAKVLIIFSCFS